MMSRILIVPCLAALVSGCSLVPDYLRPDLPVPNLWGDTAKAAPAAPAAAPRWEDVSWKQFFTDPVLQGLIQAALDHNRDLRVAALNIEVARAKYRIAESDLYPKLNAGMGDSIERTPRPLTSSQTKATVTRTYTANLGVTAYELDLFGRVSSLEAQALESYLATEEARNATQISLVAEVANAYLSLLGDRKLLVLTEETLDTRLKSLELIQRSVERGISSELDLAQARTAVETARTNQARYIRQVELDRNALSLLVGAPVDGQVATAATLDAVYFVDDLAVGLPSDVLLRRPDIIQAEHSLKAANANIGAARAAFFPTITLTGTAGFTSADLGSLFTMGSRSWSFAPQVSLPIFDAGNNQANLDSAKASRDIAVAEYEKAIQTAFREVADALAAKRTYVDQEKAQTELVAATSTSYRLSQARYDRGVDSYLTVLDSQRSLYSAQQDLIAIQVSRLSNLVTLYKVLGGGRS